MGEFCLFANPRTSNLHRHSRVYSPARSPRLVPSNVKDPSWTTIESSVFFIRDHYSGSEVIVFGDIEPDSIAYEPRNKRVWDVAATKVIAGHLRAIFIECSYDDSVEDSSLYGHLCPRHLVAELKVLATRVTDMKHPNLVSSAKRKRVASTPGGDQALSPGSKRTNSMPAVKEPPKSEAFLDTQPVKNEYGNYFGDIPDLDEDIPAPTFNDSVVEAIHVEGQGQDPDQDTNAPPESSNSLGGNIPWSGLQPPPLAGLSVYIIHVKEDMSDGPPPGDRILQELKSHGEAARLGCEFHITKRGESIWI